MPTSSVARSIMSGDEKFQLVGRRKRGKRIPRLIKEENSASCRAESYNFDAEKFSRKLNEAKEELNDSEYKIKLFHRLAEAKEILNAADVKQILCYGLGNFSENSSSKYQLALLLVVKDHLRANVHVYDPLFLPDEKLYLESLDCRVIRENEEGKRKVDSTTLVPPTMNANLKVLRSLISEIRYVASEKKMQDNVMVRYILEQSRIHRDTSEVLCKAREELKSLGETYLHYLKSQRKYNEIRKHYGGRGERTVKETADLVGFKLPHDPK